MSEAISQNLMLKTKYLYMCKFIQKHDRTLTADSWT